MELTEGSEKSAGYKVWSSFILYIQPLKMELIEGSETSANHNRTPGKYPKATYKIQNTAKVWNEENFVISRRW